jgi:hypothetical protein
MTEDSWTAERGKDFAQLRGQQIKSWIGVETALREEVAAGVPQLEHPAVLSMAAPSGY